MKSQQNTELQQKIPKLIEIAIKNRVGRLQNCNDQSSIVPFNMVLQPYPIFQHQYQMLKKLSYLWQKLTHLASFDIQLITKTFSKLQKDPMVGPMLKIYKQTLKNKNPIDEGTSKAKLSKPKIELFRTDFFITNDQTENIKLIQYNNMSVSMAGMSQQFQKSQKQLWGPTKNILQNTSIDTFAKGLVQFYKKSHLEGIFLAVVQPHQTNVIDQNLLFQEIKHHSNIEIQRVTLQKFNQQTTIDAKNDLYFKTKKVAIVYYRSGYSSKQNIQWQGIRKANLSSAVNIPSICSFLIGTKKMQAELSKKQVMNKFLSKVQADLLFTSVIQTWEFDVSTKKQNIINMIQKEGAENFVLKPNEEGGKNNLFGVDALNKIKQLSIQDLYYYILTRKIHSRSQKSYFIKSNKILSEVSQMYCQIQNQVSIFGCICTQCQGLCPRNCCGGYLVRSKPKQINEGGLISGYGGLNVLQIPQSI